MGADAQTAVTAHEAAPDDRNANLKYFVDGKIVPRSEAVVSIYDSGFMLGDGIWEGVRLHNGVFAFLDAHLDRLFEAALAIDLDIAMTHQALVEALYATADANGMVGDCHARLMVTRGVKSAPFQHPSLSRSGPTVAIIMEHSRPAIGRSLRLASVAHHRGLPLTQDAKLNSHSKLNCILACIAAEKAGADEALMFDPFGFVNTTNSCNVFIVRRGELWTSTGDYCMNGITRGHVIDLAQEAGLVVRQKNFSLVETYSADEAFLTGSFGGLTPVGVIDGRPMHQAPGPLTTRLGELYRDLVERDTASGRAR